MDPVCIVQAARRRIHDMEQEATALRAEVQMKDEDLAALERRHQEALAQIAELKAELDNNAGRQYADGSVS